MLTSVWVCLSGTAIVTEQHAAMWTDGRYFLQASQQMDSNWTLMKMGMMEKRHLSFRFHVISFLNKVYVPDLDKYPYGLWR